MVRLCKMAETKAAFGPEEPRSCGNDDRKRPNEAHDIHIEGLPTTAVSTKEQLATQSELA